jgi:LemA protein
MTHHLRRVVPTAAVLVAALMVSGCSYNRFTSGEEAIKGSWGEVQNQLQRRSDLIPNLVETVKGVAQQEQDVFGAIAESRAKPGATTPPRPSPRPTSSRPPSPACSRSSRTTAAAVEQAFKAQDELSGTGNRTVARNRFNERIRG